MDVLNGEITYTDTISASSLNQMTNAMELFAFKLAEAYGSLLIEAENNLDIYMDNRWLGKLGSGSFSNLSIGIHTLELKDRDLYWRDEVIIRENECTVIEAQVKEYGAIENRNSDIF